MEREPSHNQHRVRIQKRKRGVRGKEQRREEEAKAQRLQDERGELARQRAHALTKDASSEQEKIDEKLKENSEIIETILTRHQRR